MNQESPSTLQWKSKERLGRKGWQLFIDEEPWRWIASQVIGHPPSLPPSYSSLQELKEAVEGVEKKGARRLILCLLARREYTRGELGEHLAQRGVAPTHIHELLLWAEARGFMNDLRRAKALLASALARGKGPHWVKHRLRQLRVDERYIAELLEEHAEAFQVRLGELLAGQEADPRLLRKWTQRGFSPEEILFHLREKDLS